MYSQAGQDAFVLSLIPKGTYLEIGASHPRNINNTYALEQAGWKGWSLDIDPQCQEEWLQIRKNPLIIADALTYDYSFLPARVDYLQLDIDPSHQTLICLTNLLMTKTRFSIITFEHDFYCSGDEVRMYSRRLLYDKGYKLAKPDVEYENKSFEDWWIDPTVINSI
jgi:hypothetical protein